MSLNIPPTRTRRLLFATVAVTLSFVSVVGLLTAAEVYSRSRLARSDGLNVEAYRGKVLGRKQKNELRIAVLGGSTAFGFGILPDEALPAVLEKMLAKRPAVASHGPVSVANLAYTSQGAFAVPYTLDDYSYLEPDLVILHDGYNDVAGVNRRVFRHESPIFRLTGYFPILPLVVYEKFLLLRYGSVEAGYRAERGERPIFTPNPIQRAAAEALGAANDVQKSLESRLGQLLGPSPGEQAAGVIPGQDARSCGETWAVFCQTVLHNIEYARQRDMHVLVIGQPIWRDPKLGPRHEEQQQQMISMLQAHYGSRSDVRIVDLRWTIDLNDSSMAYDQMHMTPAGAVRLASLLVEPLEDMLAALAAER